MCWWIIEPIYDEDKRRDILRLLDWPEIAEERDLEAQDRDIRHALAELGVEINWDQAAWPQPPGVIEQTVAMVDEGGVP